MVFAKPGPNYANIFHWEEWYYKEYVRGGDFSKHFDPTVEWSSSSVSVPSPRSFRRTSPTQLWSLFRSPPKQSEPSFVADESYLNSESWREGDASDASPVEVTPSGAISLRLRQHVRVDINADRAVRIVNRKSNIVMSLNGNGCSAALLHPKGRVYQYGSRVEILAHNNTGNNKFAKMWYKGVSFTSEKCALVYLVDAAGTRTTTDNFSNMVHDFSAPVFYSDSGPGTSCYEEALSILKTSMFYVSDKGIENWIVNNVRVAQTEDGLVRVARSNGKYQLRTSPSNGTASLTTPFLHCTASLGQKAHLFVRRGERRMHYDGVNFIVRNAGHSAGFDEKNQLKVY